MGSGLATTTAPVGGQPARGCAAGSGRTCRCPAGRSGTGTPARRSARRPRRCRPSRRPRPSTGDSSATQRAHSTERPGLCGPVSSALSASCCVVRGVPAGAHQQPAAVRQRAVLGLPGPDVVDLDEEVGVRRHLGGEVEHRGRRRSAAVTGTDETSSPSLPGHPVVRRVEVGAGVLAGAEVVPVPSRAAVVVAADLLQLEPLRSARTPAAAPGSASPRTAGRSGRRPRLFRPRGHRRGRTARSYGPTAQHGLVKPAVLVQVHGAHQALPLLRTNDDDHR